MLDKLWVPPCLIWQVEDDEPDTKCFSHRRLDQDLVDQVPSLLLSDTEDETSVQDDLSHQSLSMHDKFTKREGQRLVRFGEAHVREHPMVTAGETACCTLWPLGLDWVFQDEKVYNIDEYEQMRTESGRSQRGRLHKIDIAERRRILEESSSPVHGERRGTSSDYVPPTSSSYSSAIIPPDVIEVPKASPSTAATSRWPYACDPFSIFSEDYPAMTVHVIED